MNYEYCDGITHTIKQGETLYSLSRYYKIPLAILLRANPYIDVYNLQVGDTICVPVKNCRNNRIKIKAGNMNTTPDANIGENVQETINMDMDENTPEASPVRVGMEIDENMPESTPVDTDTGIDMDNMANMDNMMSNMANMANMSNMGNIGNMGNMSNMNNMDADANRRSNGHCGDDKDDDDKDKDDEKRWIKYVAQSGDTLQDILDRSDGSEKMFWDKNNADRMYMLPGVAYFILEKD